MRPDRTDENIISWNVVRNFNENLGYEAIRFREVIIVLVWKRMVNVDISNRFSKCDRINENIIKYSRHD